MSLRIRRRLLRSFFRIYGLLVRYRKIFKMRKMMKLRLVFSKMRMKSKEKLIIKLEIGKKKLYQNLTWTLNNKLTTPSKTNSLP